MTSALSHFIRTSWKLTAQSILELPELRARIRFFDRQEADKLAELVRRKSLFARTGGPSNFYFQRLQGLAHNTVIEIFRRGHPDAISQSVERLADVFETIVLLSSSLIMSRKQFQKHLAITIHRRYGYSVTIGPNFYTLRSKATPERTANGIPVNQTYVNRFQRLTFPTLVQFSQVDSEMGQRVYSALGWLLESRQEPNLGAAFVKTAIALETLLIFNDTEPLSRCLSERCAFMLSQEPNDRALVSKLVRDFYDSRSRLVHGGGRKNDSISVNLLEAIDRLALLLCLLLATNANRWISKESLRTWCESQRWDAPDKTVRIPYSKKHFRTALKLGLSE